MSRIIVSVLFGLVAVGLGIGLILGDQSMATNWHLFTQIGGAPTVDTAKEANYRLLGFATLGFGFLVIAMALNQWMSGRDVELRATRGIK